MIAAAILVGLAFALVGADPVDKNGKVDFIGIIFGLGALVLFSFVWK